MVKCANMKPKKPILYLRRKFDAFLKDWKARENSLPLMINGARQVGKTETVRHFAETGYESYIEINFVERPEFKELGKEAFSNTSSARRSSRRACRSHITSARTRRLKWISSRGLQIALYR